MDVRQCWEDFTKTKCRLCSKALNNPRTLPCLHSFCLECLENLVYIDGTRLPEETSCPTCMSSFQIPEGKSVSDLPLSFHLAPFKDILSTKENQRGVKCSNCVDRKAAISYCYVCRDHLCFRCDEAHRRLRGTRNHLNILVGNVLSLLQRAAMCSQKNHQEEQLSLYCQQCLKCVCRVCHEESHSRHDVVYIQGAAETGKQEINDALLLAEDEITALNEKMKESSEIFKAREKDINAARRDVEAFVKLSILQLKKHKKAVLTQLDDIYAKLQQGHATKQRELELLITQLRSPVKYGKSILKRSCDVEILNEREIVITRCIDLLNSENTACESFHFPFVKYIIDEDMFKSVRDVGAERLIMSNTDSSWTTAFGVGLRDPLVERQTSFKVVTRDSRGNQCYNENDLVKIHIRNPVGEGMPSTLTDKRDGRYSVTFTPEDVGQHEVMITINEQPLTDSPWSVEVTAPHRYRRKGQLGSHGLFENGTYFTPCGIAICKASGIIAVADEFGKRVTIFSPKGKYLRHFGDVRDASKNLKRPKSVAFHSSGEIVVIDSRQMILCSNTGVFLNYYVMGVAFPESVSMSSNGQLIVCDQEEATVKILREGGGLVKSFSSDNTLDGQPSFAIHHRNKFFVSYPEAHCVKVFSDNGMFLYDIGAKGSKREKLGKPLGLAMDRFNNLVVCDSNKSRLQVYKPDGRHVATVEGKTSKLVSPQFVAVSKDGHLFVTDSGRKSKESFHLDAEQSCIHIFY